MSNPASGKQQRVVYFNGKLVPESEARVSIYDSALMFGDVAFEMTRSFNRKQFKLREHLERLIASARWLHIPFSMSVDELEECCQRVIAANDPLFALDDEHRLMIDITRGLLGIYAGQVDVQPGVNLIIADFPLRWTVQDSAHLYTEGIDVVIPSQRMIPASLLEPKAKNRNRIHYLMANVELSNYKGQNAWAVLLDPDGFLTEGTGSNFFLVKNGAIYSPEPRNILRGISRDYVIELAGDLGIPFHEKNLEPYDVMMADEAFFTCTPFSIVPAVKYHGGNIGTGKVGPIYTKLISRWSKNVGIDIIGQIQAYAAANKGGRAGGATPYQFVSAQEK
ncbi:MAG TPA: aminotransferase class IV [Opitutaceae bacterium]|jgi:branched-chain amino acid aminotransferase|nr:aminotransferase class IV [Opitutaceae bacterium]